MSIGISFTKVSQKSFSWHLVGFVTVAALRFAAADLSSHGASDSGVNHWLFNAWLHILASEQLASSLLLIPPLYFEDGSGLKKP